MSAKIKPTVGRIVWFHPCNSDPIPHACTGEPLAAIVTKAWSDTCVNLAVFDYGGNAHSRTSVTLIQEGDQVPPTSYCEWMPYQKGQAAKTDALEQRLSDKKPSANDDASIEAQLQAKGMISSLVED